MSQDYFAHKASTFDQSSPRVQNVDNIAQAIRQHITLDPTMKLLDFGSGTGLLLERLAPHVHAITAIDVSPSMNSELGKKLDTHGKLHGCAVTIIEKDLVNDKVHFDHTFDGIISSMTLHHVKDINALFAQFSQLLNQGGFIALADLATEDGSFHSEDTGVFHHGFEPSFLVETATAMGFGEVSCEVVSHIQRPNHTYEILLLTAKKL
ncbi:MULTISPECIES: class I SAM-dependent DNA methyltransferase [unclassified Moraxella]|uniref:class I SAM-dependent DNA methyltransferase n=1 Tax=unclassified Moraxella TaxID=2685852 RepID=UPI003AF8E2A2